MTRDFNVRPASYVAPRGRLERLACKALLGFMLYEDRIKVDFGDEDVSPSDAEFVLAPPRLWIVLKLLAMPDMWVGESYLAGDWYLVRGRLADFLEAVEQQAKPVFRAYYNFVSTMKGIRFYLSQYVLNRQYTRRVKRHYEVDPKIYEMILDEEMFYTCAFFLEQGDSLAAAQQNKAAVTIRRMSLPSGPIRILDIGCGWGGMARAMARANPHAEICGLSISGSQIEWARRKDAETLSPQERARIEYRQEDYVDHNRLGNYDAISVVGMIEHVGLGGYDEFFSKIHGLLKPGGTLVIHTIVSPLPTVPTNSWIDRHIFVGGYAPSISELINIAERHPFHISGVHVHHPSNYRRTIECWLENFLANVGRVRSNLAAIGYSDFDADRFVRTWVFYLSGVRNMFVGDQSRSHQVIQLCAKKLSE